MHQPLIDSTTLEGQRRIRAFALCWLERLDYSRKLDRSWPATELGNRLWARFEHEYAPHCKGELVTNRPIAEILAISMVEDYYAAYPERRETRYTVTGPLDDAPFRRCVLDFVHDLEEFEPAVLPATPIAAAEMFWADVRANPARWDYDPEDGPFVDDEHYAGFVALEALNDYYALKAGVAELRERSGERRAG
jgi:hypothetical protein